MDCLIHSSAPFGIGFKKWRHLQSSEVLIGLESPRGLSPCWLSALSSVGTELVNVFVASACDCGCVSMAAGL